MISTTFENYSNVNNSTNHLNWQSITEQNEFTLYCDDGSVVDVTKGEGSTFNFVDYSFIGGINKHQGYSADALMEYVIKFGGVIDAY